jgi:hypothetical protein
MDRRYELPLQVGETVRYDTHGVGGNTSGVIVERLGGDYLRVLWSDMSAPTTHRSHSLKRAQAHWDGRH